MGKIMDNTAAEYICVVVYDNHLPNEGAWRSKLHEFGLDREAFTLTQSPTGNAVVRFWEPDRVEALRILTKLDGMRTSPCF